MTVSRTSEYALRAVTWLAAHPEGAFGTGHIARETQVPEGYLSKVLQQLARAGLVSSRPGRSGGFVLSRTPRRMTVLEVVSAVDPLQRITSCPLKLKAHRHCLCPLHRRLDDAIASVQSAFAATPIADLLVPENGVQPLFSE
jgi:Rrf2 family protein